MNKYLLDTNICIYYLKGLYLLDEKIAKVKSENCFLCEITIAELKYGAENSAYPSRNRIVVNNFISGFKIIPIFSSLEIYASEKTRLRKSGSIIDEFDLLIGASAITNNLILVTNNVKHFKRMKGIQIEDWTK